MSQTSDFFKARTDFLTRVGSSASTAEVSGDSAGSAAGGGGGGEGSSISSASGAVGASSGAASVLKDCNTGVYTREYAYKTTPFPECEKCKHATRKRMPDQHATSGRQVQPKCAPPARILAEIAFRRVYFGRKSITELHFCIVRIREKGIF
jgi:hypothetical protein